MAAILRKDFRFSQALMESGMNSCAWAVVSQRQIRRRLSCPRRFVMHTYVTAWIIVFGLATFTAGCASLESPGGSRMADRSDHQRLKGSSPVIANIDSGT